MHSLYKIILFILQYLQLLNIAPANTKKKKKNFNLNNTKMT